MKKHEALLFEKGVSKSRLISICSRLMPDLVVFICFSFFQLVSSVNKYNLLKLEHTLLHLASQAELTQGVVYFLAIPHEDGQWFVR